jgi:hypothetical protein
MAFENESLMADNRRYCAEVTDLAGENSALLASNKELRGEGDALLVELRNMRQVVAVNRTDLLYLKLKLKGLELRLSEDAEDEHLLEDIAEWKRSWRRAKGLRDLPMLDGNDVARAIQEGASNSDDTRSTISLEDGSQLIITRAARSRPTTSRGGRSASISTAGEARSEPDEAELPEDAEEGYEDEAQDGFEDEEDEEGYEDEDEEVYQGEDEESSHGSNGPDDETVTQEAVPPPQEIVKSPWERLWDDLAAFAGVHD